MSAIIYQRFHNYLEIRAKLPKLFWHIFRLGAFIIVGGMIWLSYAKPTMGNILFWYILLPLAPLIFLIVPGFWRNICPAAILNQIPKRLGFGLRLKLGPLVRKWYFTISIILLFGSIFYYPIFVGKNEHATVMIMLFFLGLAFLGGIIFEGKAGWCGTFCPMSSIEKIWGHTPLLNNRNAFCNDCVGCQKNCMDFLPRAAFMSDVYDDNNIYRKSRILFLAIFLGFLFAIFSSNIFNAALDTAFFNNLFIYCIISLSLYHLARAYLPISSYRLTSLYTFSSFGIFYYFMTPHILENINVFIDAFNQEKLASIELVNYLSNVNILFIYAGIGLVMLTCFIISIIQELRFSIMQTYPGPLKIDVDKISRSIHEYTDGMSVTEITNDFTFSIFEGQTLLDALEVADFHIESGCRMGLCGSDPIAITAGEENISPMTMEEADTLEKLGLKGQARLACMVKTSGSIGISIDCFSSDAVSLANMPTTDIGWGLLEVPANKGGDDPLKEVKIVVVGNGVAGMSTVQYLRRLSPNANITIVSNEIYPFYNRMGLTKLLENRLYNSDNMLLLHPDWYEQHNIKQLLNTQISQIDTGNKKLIINSTEFIKYDKLVIAIGAKVKQPNIPGTSLEGCYTIKSMEDMLEVSNYIPKNRVKHATIVGGGWLGIEIATILKRRNIHVTLIHHTDYLLNKIGNQTASTILMNYLLSQGIEIIFSATVTRLGGHGRVQNVNIIGKTEATATELCIFTIGSESDNDFVGRSSIRCSKGILVNRKMQTSNPDVYAVGDCVELTEEPLGLWGASMEMGKIAALNLAEKPTDFNTDTCYLPYILKVRGIDFRNFGQTIPEADDKIFENYDKKTGKYWFVVVNNENYVVGGVFINHAEMANSFFKAMRFRLDAFKLLPAEAIHDDEHDSADATIS